MTAPLEGAALFNQVAKALDYAHWTDAIWDEINKWLLVPAMLEWLRGREMAVVIDIYNVAMASVIVGDDLQSTEGPDLPTALARLVLRVAELEGKA